MPRQSTHPSKHHRHRTSTHKCRTPQHLGVHGCRIRHPPHKMLNGTTLAQSPGIRPHHASRRPLEHDPRLTHPKTVSLLLIRQWTRTHTSRTLKHHPHPKARAHAAGHHATHSPAAPIPDTHSDKNPTPGTKGQAVHGLRQPILLPHTNPTTRHHTRPLGELLQRLEDSIRIHLYYAALFPDSLAAHLHKARLQLAVE